MTSKISFFDRAVWRRSLRKTLPLWICYLLCWFLMMPGTFLNFNYGYEHYRALSGELCEQVLGFCTIGSCVAAVIGVLAAWVLFSWLFRANASYFYAGLPVRREALFVTNALLGLVMVTLIHLLTALASYLVLLLHGYPQLYFQFLANVLHTGMDDVIVPLPQYRSSAVSSPVNPASSMAF